jgi:hypothetical protein
MLALGAGESVVVDTCSGYTTFAATILLSTEMDFVVTSIPLGSLCVVSGAERLQYTNTGPARTFFVFVGGEE